MTGWIRRHGALLVYPLIALAAYPASEYLLAGTRAQVYGLDVFDDGSVARLGALAPAWREHGFSLWNALLTTGNAWFSQFALPPIAPDSLLTLVLAPFHAFVLVQASLAAVAGLAMHLFLRRSLRLPRTAAVVGASIYAFSLWHYPIGLAGPMLPLLLTLVDRPPRNRAGGIAILAAVVVVALHQGLLQVVVLAGAAQLAWIAFGTARRRRRDALVTWLRGWLVASLVAAPMLMSLALALPSSHRVVWDIAPHLSVDVALREVMHRWASVVLALPMDGGWGLHAPYEGTWFAGAVALPLAVVGAVRGAVAGRRFRLLAALLLVLPLIDLASLLAGPLLEDAGPLGSFQLDRVRHFAPFVVSGLAAVGLAGIGGIRGRRRRGWAARLALVFAGALLTVQLPSVIGRLDSFTALGDELAPAWLRATWLAAGIGGLTGLAIVVWRPRSRPVLAAAAIVMLLLLGVERATYARVERGAVPNGTSTWSARLGSSEVTQRLQSETARDHARALVTGLYPNRLLFHRIPSVTGYENVYPLRIHQLLDVLFAPYLDAHPEDAAYYRRWGNRAVAFEPVWARQIVDLLAARWIVADGPIDGDDLTLVGQDGTRTLYRNDSALPRAFVVTSTRVFGERDAMLDALAAADTRELATTALLEAEVPHSDAGTGSARFVVDAPDRLRVEVSAPGSGVLVVSDAFMPGWQATIDGAPAEVVPVDVALRGVAVPGGESTVVMWYAPAHMPFAAAAALLGLVTLAALGVIAVRNR